jgi:flagellar basal-body rod protein FlgB
MASQPSVINYLEAGLSASTLRQKAIANNLANVDTPGFRRNEVAFETVLADAMDSPSGVDFEKIQATLTKPMNTPVKGNGNDVEINHEVGQLMKSASRHKAYLKLLGKLYKQMEMAMQDRF